MAPAIGCNCAYFRSKQGILKILQIVSGIAFLVSALMSERYYASLYGEKNKGQTDTYPGSYWVFIAAILAIVCASLFLFLYFCNIVFKCPGRVPCCVFAIYFIVTLLVLTAAIIATVAVYVFDEQLDGRILETTLKDIKDSPSWKLVLATGFSAAFGYLTFLLFLVDTLFFFGSYQRNVVETTVGSV